MGCCKSKQQQEVQVTKPGDVTPGDVTVSTIEGASTSQLLRIIFDAVLPRVRSDLCKGIITYAAAHANEEVPRFIRKEEPVEKYDANDLPLGPLKLTSRSVVIVDAVQMKADMAKYPEFEWPSEVIERMTKGSDGAMTMICVDLLGVDIEIRFAPHCELQWPLPAGLKLEVGSDGAVKEGSLAIVAPRLRVWYDLRSLDLLHGNNGEYMLAFMETPQVSPNLHVNVDLFGGEVGMNVAESGILDDLVEVVLTGFGPCSPKGKLSGLFAEKLGGALVATLDTFASLGNGRPFRQELQATAADIRKQIAELELLATALEEKERSSADQ